MSVDIPYAHVFCFIPRDRREGRKMGKHQQRSAKKAPKSRFSLREADLFCTDSVLLRSNRSAVLYGCGRILFYGSERICFAMGKRSVSVFGKDLRCTVFSPSGVTVEGEITGITYCAADCQGVCQKTSLGEGEA